MKDSKLKKELLLFLNKFRLFRNNTGNAWQGRAEKIKDAVLLHTARRVQFGLVVGSSDLIGWFTKIITLDDVGKKVAIFTAVEAKSEKDKLSQDQKYFLNGVAAQGGIALLAKVEGKKINIYKYEDDVETFWESMDIEDGE